MTSANLRKPTNLSLDSKLLEDARSLKVNLSRAAEEGIGAAVRLAQEQRWKAENKQALNSSNDYVEARGLPLSADRQF